MADLPTVIGPAGLVPQPPQTIRDQILADAEALSPGLTADLPGLLIEDVLSTDVAAIVVADQARVDLVNSLTPYGANAFLLLQLGVNVYGVPVQEPSNTSVLVVVTGIKYVLGAIRSHYVLFGLAMLQEKQAAVAHAVVHATAGLVENDNVRVLDDGS